MRSSLDRKLIGEVLVERGLITPEDLDRALEYQKGSPHSYIGEILIKLGCVSEIDVVTALVVQCNLPYIAISRHTVEEHIIKLIPAEMARARRIIPLDRIGQVLSIVMASPMGDTLRGELERMTGCRIATFLSTPSEIDAALARFYP